MKYEIFIKDAENVSVPFVTPTSSSIVIDQALSKLSYTMAKTEVYLHQNRYKLSYEAHKKATLETKKR